MIDWSATAAMSANKWDEVQKKLPSLSKALAEEINKSKPQHQQL